MCFLSDFFIKYFVYFNISLQSYSISSFIFANVYLFSPSYLLDVDGIGTDFTSIPISVSRFYGSHLRTSRTKIQINCPSNLQRPKPRPHCFGVLNIRRGLSTIKRIYISRHGTTFFAFFNICFFFPFNLINPLSIALQ